MAFSRGRTPQADRGGRVKYLFLLIPCVLAVCTPLYNVQTPALFGVPFFYWFQMLVVVLSSLCIFIADRLGRA